MAVTTTTITPIPAPFPLQTLGQLERQYTPMPQLLWRFTDSSAVTAGGAGNEQKIDLQLDLPATFACAIQDLALYLYPSAAQAQKHCLFGII